MIMISLVRLAAAANLEIYSTADIAVYSNFTTIGKTITLSTKYLLPKFELYLPSVRGRESEGTVDCSG